MDDKLTRFLNLCSFSEYMDQYEFFCGLKMGKDTFAKEMQLMETDDTYTHRRKDTIRQAKKRAVVRSLKERVGKLQKEIAQEGVWRKIGEDPYQEILISYEYPSSKRGDVDHYIASTYYETEQVGETTYQVRMPISDYERIELMTLPAKNLFSHYDFDGEDEDEAMRFLLTYNRIAMIEKVMSQVNYYTQEYRNMRSIRDLPLKNLLKDYHKVLDDKRNEIYEKLIGAGITNARWISEQKAFAIVKEHYPDAKFQYQADFLYGQRLDICIPSIKAGIEYQGKQHYEAVDFFGSEGGLKDNKRRDEAKMRRCKMNGVRLFYWDFDKPLTDEYFESELMPLLEERL